MGLNTTFTKEEDDGENTTALNRTFNADEKRKKSSSKIPRASSPRIAKVASTPIRRLSHGQPASRSTLPKADTTIELKPTLPKTAGLIGTLAIPESGESTILHFNEECKQPLEATTQGNATESCSSTKLLPENPALSDFELLAKLMEERDQYRNQTIKTYQTIGELIKQQETFMKSEIYYHECLAKASEERQQAINVIADLHKRYHDLRTDAEHMVEKINTEIADMINKHKEDTRSLRFRCDQQGIQIKSLETQIKTLKIERQETMKMCDELVAKCSKDDSPVPY